MHPARSPRGNYGTWPAGADQMGGNEDNLASAPLWEKLLASNLADKKLLKRKPGLLRTGGVPAQLRGRVWMQVSGAQKKFEAHLNVYNELLHRGGSASAAQIHKDLKRSLPEEMMNNEAIEAMRRVLIAYSLYNPVVGYCQSMNFICAVFLLYMSEEEAFWLLSVVVEDLAKDFFTHSMLGMKCEAQVLADLLEERTPKLMAHFKKLQVEVLPVVYKWFLTLFINCLPIEGALRFLDVYLFEGHKILLRVSLSLFKLAEKRFLACNDFESAFMLLSTLPSKAPAPTELFRYVFDRRFIGSMAEMWLSRRKEKHTAQQRQESQRDIRVSGDSNTPPPKGSFLSSTFQKPSPPPSGSAPLPPSVLASASSSPVLETRARVRGGKTPPCLVNSSPSVAGSMFDLPPPPVRPTLPPLPKSPREEPKTPPLPPSLHSQVDPSFQARIRPLSYWISDTPPAEDALVVEEG